MEPKFTATKIIFNDAITSIINKKTNTPDLMQMITNLCRNKKRNKFIIKMITFLFSQNKRILCMCSQIDHIDLLYGLLNQNISTNNNVGKYIGRMSMQEIQESITKKIIIGTYLMIDKNIDFNHIDIVIMLSPKKSIETSVNNIFLKNKNINIIDLVDKNSIFKRFSDHRTIFYIKNNFDVKIIDANDYISQCTQINSKNTSLEEKLPTSNIDGSDLIDEKLPAPIIGGSDLIEEKLSTSNIGGSDLIEEKLSTSNIDGSDLIEEKLLAPIIDGSDLIDEKLSTFNIDNSNLIEEKLPPSIIIPRSKLIGCSIHGHIRVSPLALCIIDTPEFQRLRNIKQLGLCHYIYPVATHTRFEHSIGVYHLAGKMVEKLQKNYPDYIYDIPELGPTKLTDFVGELIKIGGLCHDLGHGPYSHIFDDIMWEITKSPNADHETRSCLIIEKVCHKYLSTELSDSHIKFIQSIINPRPEHTGAIYQIVSNYLNGIDVDKFDYLARDSHALGLKKGFDHRRIIDEIIIDNKGNIAYSKHCSVEIYDMFQTRYMMHKLVYNHKGTKIIESMVSDIIMNIDPIFNISDSIYNMDDFCKLTDDSIFSMLEYTVNPPHYLESKLHLCKKINTAYEIYQNINHRKLYKCVAEITNGSADYFDNFIIYLKNKNYSTDNLQIITTKIGFVSGNKTNPFDSIYFYDRKELSDSSFILDKNQISIMLHNNYIETHHFLICKNRLEYSNMLSMYREYIALHK